MHCIRIAFGALAVLAAAASGACSSTSTTRASDACSPGEITSCELPVGCTARKTCNPDGKSYGPCQCVSDAGSPGGSAGAGGTGGGASGRGGTSGGSAGSGGSGASSGSSGTLGSAGTTGSGGAAGTSGGTAGRGGTEGTGGGAAGTSGANGDGGTAGSGGSGGCLTCMAALAYDGLVDDSQLCAGSRAPYAQLIECACNPTGTCAPACTPHCMNPTMYPLTPNCQMCLVPTCGNLAVACMNAS